MVVYDVEVFLQKVRLMIESALNTPEIQQKLISCNYDINHLMVGRDLFEELLQLQQSYEREYGKKSTFLEAIKRDQKFAFKTYIQHQKIVHNALKASPGLEEALNLHLSTTEDTEDWLDQANIFYKKVNFIAKDLSEFGIEASEVAQGKAMVEALKDAKQMQRKLQKNAHEATLQRDKALNAMQQWIYKFNNIAQIALQNDSFSLESLGIELES